MFTVYSVVDIVHMHAVLHTTFTLKLSLSSKRQDDSHTVISVCIWYRALQNSRALKQVINIIVTELLTP